MKEADRKAIEDAIAQAERGSSGEVRVHLERRCPGDALARARQVFAEQRMDATKERTGVLLYVAEKDRKAAVYADEGLHGAAEPGFWQSVTDEVARGYRAQERIGGLTRALEKIGSLLRDKFPAADHHGDELPDQVSTE